MFQVPTPEQAFSARAVSSTTSGDPIVLLKLSGHYTGSQRDERVLESAMSDPIVKGVRKVHVVADGDLPAPQLNGNSAEIGKMIMKRFSGRIVRAFGIPDLVGLGK